MRNVRLGRVTHLSQIEKFNFNFNLTVGKVYIIWQYKMNPDYVGFIDDKGNADCCLSYRFIDLPKTKLMKVLYD